MNLKKITILVISTLVLATSLTLAGCGDDEVFPRPEPDYNSKIFRDFTPFEKAMGALTDDRRAAMDEFLSSATIPQIQARFDDGSLSSVELVVYYLDRIKRYDVNNFNSVLSLNPRVLEEAATRDTERAGDQSRGMMHGIPILLKDNIATRGLNTTAGAYAMKDWMPDRDAPVTASLREAGAIILGKANLSEWANWMDENMPSGFSALGGQTRNVYGPFEVWGSSSGSAVAAAANFAVVTVGSETQGSLLLPASINSAVGLKPTHALVPGDYIIPLMPFQDNAGPMARSVTDAAILLTAMGREDENYLDYLTAESLSGLRLGMTGEDDALQAVFKKLGAQVAIIDVKDLPGGDAGVFGMLPPVFKYATDDFLPTVNAPVKSLGAVIAFNKEDMTNRAPYGQGNLEKSQNTELSKAETEQKVDQRIKAYAATLTTLFDKYNVDVIFDSANQGGIPLSQAYAPAGWPAMSIPAGYSDSGEPFSFGFAARPYAEGKMLAVAFAVEQATRAYRPPNLDATLKMMHEKLGD